MKRCLLFAAAAVLLGPATSSAGHLRRFPYEAVVEGNDVYARSGPGRNYYPTAKLKRGEKVTVHRHDPGGWYMIAPPPGSFSWIRADYVKTESPGRGVLTENDVVVRIGSEFGDERDVEQVRLSKGDTVTILGEKTFSTSFGRVRTYKIAPPRGEYRWVQGRHIVPADASARKVNDRDPYSVPSQVERKPDGSHEIGHPIGRDAGTGPKLGPPNHTPDAQHPGPDGGSFERDRQKLAHIDARFRAMVAQDTSTWDFRQLEREYRELKRTASHPLIASKIEHRFATIEHYRSIKAEYSKMIQLTSETQRRDAELAGMQPGTAATLAGPTAIPPSEESSGPSAGPALAAPGPNGQPPAMLPTPGQQPPAPGRSQSSFRPPIRQPGPSPRSGVPRRSAAAQPPARFDGAGIIRRVQPAGRGMPSYGLFAPDGRLLAYLQPVPGLPMHRYVGRPMGVYGRRTHRPEWRSDYIVVRAMMPVRLLP